MEALGLDDAIDDILITLGRQYHLIRLVDGRQGTSLFMYLALDRNKANLAMARHRLRRIEQQLAL
jgi:hypothetical protein